MERTQTLTATRTHVRVRLGAEWGVRYVLGVFVLLRLGLSALAAWLLALRPLHETVMVRAQYLGQTPLHDAILGPWQRFDALWYMWLATHGYGAHDGSTVYFPLYPLLIKLVSVPLGGNAMLAALVVSNLCLIGLLLVLHRLVAGRFGIGAARGAVLLLCVFPTSFFLLGAYTESLFLLLVVGSFLAIDGDRRGLAALLAFLAALTRLQGIVLALPLVWMAAAHWRAPARGVWWSIRHDWRPRWGWVLTATAPLLGTTLFMAYARLVVHAGLVTSVYTRQIHQQLNAPWVTLGTYAAALNGRHWRLFAYSTGNWVDALNLILPLAMLALVLPARRVLGTPLWLYALATLAVTLCIHQSTARYMLTVFPAFIVLAMWRPGRRTTQMALLLGAPIMLFMAGEFVLWSFVG